MKKFTKLTVLCLIITLFITSASVLASKAKAKEFYQQGETYSSEGRWDLAADAYAKAAKEDKKFKDVQSKLENARVQACDMLVQMGDDAKNKEKFDEALALYQKALIYQPTSIEAKSRADSLNQEMVAKYYNRGRTYESQNLWQEALKEYEKAYAINPNYEDLADYYGRAKAKLQGNVPVRALLFLVNRSGQPGLDNTLIQALHAQLNALAPSKKFFLVDQRKVQAVMSEQADALGDKMNESLAMDLGRLLDANQVIIGEIHPDGKDKVKIIAKILKVPDQGQVSDAKVTLDLDEIKKDLPKVAKNLAKKLVD